MAYEVYRGPSMLTGEPIVVIATGVDRSTENGKIGSCVVQFWILRADMEPVRASRVGADRAICGDCKHMGEPTFDVHGRGTAMGRSCYVTLVQAQLGVFRKHERGGYARVTPHEMARLCVGRVVRLGAYGDPYAVPMWVWDPICVAASQSGGAVLGYTHQWHRPDAWPLMLWCMASCDTSGEAEQARRLGWRVFRVRSAYGRVRNSEVVCCASEEAGTVTECAKCRACGGHSSKAKASIVIKAHGTPGFNFRRNTVFRRVPAAA